MPRGDGTGPWGMGAMTGRVTGYCVENLEKGTVSPALGRGMGLGRGRRRGCGFGMGAGRRRGWDGAASPQAAYAAPNTPMIAPQNEVEALRNQAKYFADALESINKRIAELQGESK